MQTIYISLFLLFQSRLWHAVCTISAAKMHYNVASATNTKSNYYWTFFYQNDCPNLIAKRFINSPAISVSGMILNWCISKCIYVTSTLMSLTPESSRCCTVRHHMLTFCTTYMKFEHIESLLIILPLVLSIKIVL